MAIERHPALKEWSVKGCNLTSTETELLARAISKMEKVTLQYFTTLTTKQCQAIFRFATASDSKLKILEMGDSRENDGTSDLSTVDADTLAKVINKLEEVRFYQANLTSQQCQAIFGFAAASDSKLKKLFIEGSDFSAVDANTLARVTNKLEEVRFYQANLTSLQCQAIFGFAAANDSKLKSLDMGDSDLTTVDADTLARVIIKLEDMGSYQASLTAVQSQALFRSAAANDFKLKRLDIGCYSDLSAVDADTLARGITKLENVVLDVVLTADQSQALFRFAAGNGSKLKILDILCCDLSAVDADTLARGIIKLENVVLQRLTADQSQALFRFAAANDSELKSLKIYRSDLSTVDADTLARVINKLENVCLDNLVSQQCQAIFGFAAASDSKLKSLSIGDSDVSAVDAGTLARVINKLEHVGLEIVGLTAVQSQALFGFAAANNSKLKRLFIAEDDLSTVMPECLAKAVAKIDHMTFHDAKLTTQQKEEIIAVCGLAKLRIVNPEYPEVF